MNFSKQEREILNECITITKIKPTPLLRILIMASLDELLNDIENNRQITLPVTEELQSEKVYSLPVAVDEETQCKYEKLKKYLPMHSANFTKMMIMPKLRNIQRRKQSIGEILI